jgi:hypothetical protein
MKKTVIYETKDGNKFATRKEAIRHETDLTRLEAVTKFIVAKLNLADKEAPVAVDRVIALICKENSQITMLLSARYARGLGGLPGPKRNNPSGRVCLGPNATIHPGDLKLPP